jgi:CHAT domain-containing protein
LPKREEIEKAARRFHELLALGDRSELRVQVKLAAAELSRIVLGPVASQLGNKILLIVADGALQYVPFAALPIPETRRDGGAETRRQVTDLRVSASARPRVGSVPLIAEHEIINLPSSSVLAVLRRETANRQSASKLLAVLADPVFQSDDPRVINTRSEKTIAPSPAPDGKGDAETRLTRAARESGVASLERLIYTRQEADAIAALAPQGKSLKAVDFDASRERVMAAETGQYRIVHFATHGLINSQHPELSGVVLSLVDESGQPQDGFLRLHDVYNLKLGADLVVLSACRTALGKEVKGEGLMGLVRGFMYAGAPRIVASLWDVKDEATAELMKRFYEGMLKRGMRPAAALRAAQVGMWKEKRWEAAYHWAGFALQGEWR